MDIMKGRGQIVVNTFGFRLLLEKIARNGFLLLNGLSIRTQQHTDAFGQCVDFYWDFLYYGYGGSIGLNEKMKMIGHKTPGQEIGMSGDVLFNFLKEEIIVSFFEEDGSFIITSVVNMIKTAVGELHILKIQDGLIGVKTPQRCKTPCFSLQYKPRLLYIP